VVDLLRRKNPLETFVTPNEKGRDEALPPDKGTTTEARVGWEGTGSSENPTGSRRLR